MLRQPLALAPLALVLALAPARAAPPECRLDPRCPSEGRCTAVGDDCVIGSAEDCLASGDCQHHGRCVYDPSRRACDFPIGSGGDCKDTPACRQDGRCTFRVEDWGRYCAPSETSCPASFGCKMFGRCTPQGLDGCGGDRFEGCGGKACKLGGACAADSRDGTCYPTPASCARAAVCKRGGRCTTDAFSAHETPGPCRPTADGCAKSEVCALFGRCALVDGRCAVTDCAATEACKVHGACHLVDGRCSALADPRATCEREEVTGLVVTASSAQKAWKTYTFDGANLVDRDLGTSWQPAKGQGVGARVELDLPEPREVVAVLVANGFQRRDGLGDLQMQNGMLGHVLVERRAPDGTIDKDLVELAFDREPQRSSFRWDEVALPARTTDRVSLTALSVAPGLLWDDLAVSEVRVFACRRP